MVHQRAEVKVDCEDGKGIVAAKARLLAGVETSKRGPTKATEEPNTMPVPTGGSVETRRAYG